MENDIVIQLKDIRKTFIIDERKGDSIRNRVFNFFNPNHSRKLEALKGVDIKIKKGEFFGIVGRNGSGKSTLLKIIMGAIQPDAGGIVEVNGKMIRLALGMGFDPQLSARDNVYLNASLLGLSFKQIGAKFDEIIEFAELEKFVDTKIQFFSSGMRSRLAFSVAVHVEADIFLIDEFFGGVGDIRFKEKSEKIFKEVLLKGKTVVHVSHNLATLKNSCDRVMVLDRGIQTYVGKPDQSIEQYRSIMSLKKKHLK